MSNNFNIPRSSGILFHPTSLPGKFGIGDLGKEAFKWIDFLANTGQKWWQVLPLGPTGYADSPYQCFSAFAGNPYLISLEKLEEYGLLSGDFAGDVYFPENMVDYGRVIPFKVSLLNRAWENYKSGSGTFLTEHFQRFCEEENDWLEDYSLFMALKNQFGGKSWLGWEKPLRFREEGVLEDKRIELLDSIEKEKFFQFLFFSQWKELKGYANEKGIKIIGDAPIFVSSDSSDVWAYPEGFLLDEDRKPSFVAGVPPDYFSPTGQLWGNPQYDWENHKKNNYSWWKKRLTSVFKLVDLVRIDHFRGFEAYWEIPANMPTAEVGKWVKGPGFDFFDNISSHFGGLPIIAEDLGVITPEVDALRIKYDFPGMRILQFAFGGGVESRFLPHNYERNTVVYTGTHDNDTTKGFYEKASEHEKNLINRYLCVDGKNITYHLLRLAFGSVANLAVVPLQDILNLGSEARMNIPGTVSGNWNWRLISRQLDDNAANMLRELTYIFQR